jgi:hypothetical protein
MQEPTDTSSVQPGAGEVQSDRDIVSPSDGERKGVTQNELPENFVDISQILHEPGSADEEESDSGPVPSIQFRVTVGATPGKTAGLTTMRDLIRIQEEIEAFRFTSTEDGVINLFRESSGLPWNSRLLYQSLALPINVKGFRTTRELFTGIVALLQKHVMLPRKECSLLAYWSLATWFSDYLPFVPCLAISGPASTADLLLRTLVAVCRRPVLLANLSPAVLLALPVRELMPTLLLRQPQLNRQIASLLEASNQPGYLFFHRENFQQLYCPKCIYMG